MGQGEKYASWARGRQWLIDIKGNSTFAGSSHIAPSNSQILDQCHQWHKSWTYSFNRAILKLVVCPVSLQGNFFKAQVNLGALYDYALKEDKGKKSGTSFSLFKQSTAFGSGHSIPESWVSFSTALWQWQMAFKAFPLMATLLKMSAVSTAPCYVRPHSFILEYWQSFHAFMPSPAWPSCCDRS